MSRPCDVGREIRAEAASRPELVAPLPAPEPPRRLGRRGFLRRTGVALASLSCGEFLAHFLRFGLPRDARAESMATDASRQAADPRFLIYWFLEGGWLGYDMFNPVVTENHIHRRLEDPSDERYRVLRFGEEGWRIRQHGKIRHGFLADEGRELFGDMAVLSSMHTGTGHSSERLSALMGSYSLRAREDRRDDERSVLQAFAEAKGQPYALPGLSWHWWLSDGELNEAQYTGRKGFYHALGPVHAHTIYAGTPARLREFLRRMSRAAQDEVHGAIETFLDDAHRHILDDTSIEAVKSYHSARSIYQQLVAKGRRLEPAFIDGLFSDPALREEFGVRREDELITYRSVNGNKARSKFSPNTNVQAMMAYELLRAGLSCGFWIESRDVRRFDSHRSRSRLWESKGGQPVGQTDQTEMLREDLWMPLKALVRRLRTTPLGDDGESLWDRTTIVLTSEFGRSIHGDVSDVLRSKASEEEKRKKIDGQDICQHWPVTSAAFLGGSVQGDSQFGKVGDRTLKAIPILPDGSLDPAFDATSGELLPGREKNARSWIPNHGDVYATALDLCDVDPRGRGRNERGPLKFVKRGRRF